MSLRWSRLSCPLRCTKSCCPSRYSAPIASISNTEFVLAHHHEDFSGLCTCNSEENEWNKIEIEYPDNFSLGIHSIAVDSISNTVYICTQTQLLSVNMKNNNISKQQCNVLATFYFEKVPQIFYISDLNVIHVINFKNHDMFDLNAQSFIYDLFHDDEDMDIYLDPGSMVYMQSKQCIIGRSLTKKINNSVSEFSLITNKWHHHKEWIPLKLIGKIGRSVITKQEDYIFSIGTQQWLPSQNEFKDLTQILIYDVKHNNFKMSEFEIPSKELSFITITNDEIRDLLLVFGYIRIYDKLIPLDLIRFIKKWICVETLHFVADNDEKNQADHWIIDIDKILESGKKMTLMKHVN